MTKGNGAERAIYQEDGDNNWLFAFFLMAVLAMAVGPVLDAAYPSMNRSGPAGIAAASIKAGNYICGRAAAGCIPLRK